MDLQGVMKLASETAGAGAAVFATIQYGRNVRTRHAEWLLSLFERFYEQERYQSMRTILDSPPDSPALHQLEADISNRDSTRSVEEFDNYLNFFEFVAVLEARKQLKQDEICDLFDYYLRKLKSHPFVVEYVDRYGFEQLRRLLKQLKG
jgi:hypothetical protein